MKNNDIQILIGVLLILFGGFVGIIIGILLIIDGLSENK